MRILFDQGTPVPLRRALSHEVVTAYELGWALLRNGDLLTEAEKANFDLLITTDKALKYQQNLSGRKLAILVLPFASWPKLKNKLPAIATAVNSIKPGEYSELNLSD
jgi:hypothetical protein